MAAAINIDVWVQDVGKEKGQRWLAVIVEWGGCGREDALWYHW